MFQFLPGIVVVPMELKMKQWSDSFLYNKNVEGICKSSLLLTNNWKLAIFLIQHSRLQNNNSSQSDFDLTTRCVNIQAFDILQQRFVSFHNRNKYLIQFPVNQE